MPENTELERFLEMWEWVKQEQDITSDAELLKLLGYSSRSMISEIKGGRAISDKLLNSLTDTYGISRKYVKEGSLPKTNTEDSFTNNPQTVGDGMRYNKAFGQTKREPLKVVPNKAVGGYTQHYTDPKYIHELQPMNMPGLEDYTDPDYRAFEVDGDSMEYLDSENQPRGIMKGSHVVAKFVEPSFWDHTPQYYVHVVVTDDQILVKRLYRKGNYFVLISDNPFYPQILLKKEAIKEIWLVKRHIDFSMPPPRKFDIDIDIPDE